MSRREGAALALLVGVVSAAAVAVLLLRAGVYKKLSDLVDKLFWKYAPPSFPRPPGSARPPAGAAAGPPAPAAAGPPAPARKGCRAPKDGCPDGSGTCCSDDAPPKVPTPPWPKGCSPEELSAAAEHFRRNKKWTFWTSSVPVFGTLAYSIGASLGWPPDPNAEANDAFTEAGDLLKDANALWQDAYARFIQTLAPEMKMVSEDVLGPEGYISVLATYASLPLVHAAQLLVAPLLGLLLCSLVLVWAV